MAGNFRTDCLNVSGIVTLQENRSCGNRVTTSLSVYSKRRILFVLFRVVRVVLGSDFFRVFCALGGLAGKVITTNHTNHTNHTKQHEAARKKNSQFRSALIRLIR
jgi:hypothetical protein